MKSGLYSFFGKITSRASGGVKDGSASRIGVVSGEAILAKSGGVKELTEMRVSAERIWHLPGRSALHDLPPKCTPNG